MPITAIGSVIHHTPHDANLAHCYSCTKNTNNIVLLLTLGYDFRTAVAILERWLQRHESRLPKAPTTQEAQ